MRLFPGFQGALLILAIGVPGKALAACCMTATPVHVYVPPPAHVVIVPHTTYIRPVTSQVHPHVPNNTSRSIRSSSSTVPAVAAKPTRTHEIVQPIVVANQAAATSPRCKGQHAGEGCKKKDDEQTGWANLRRWLQLDKH